MQFLDQKVRWAGTDPAAAEGKDALGRHRPSITERRAVLGGGGVRVEASKHFEKTEKLIVLFWSLELHLMYWPHIEL